MSKAIREVSHLSKEEFYSQILPAGEPLVIRGLAKDWPIVNAARLGNEKFCNYLKNFDRGYEVDTVVGPSSINGRIFYNADLSGLNCRITQAKLSGSLDYLLENAHNNPPPLLAIQSAIINHHLPGLEQENLLELVPDTTQPRLWVGGQATVAAHFDASENIAVCVAGKRRFTLLPPEQVSNLYVGPYELTPAGPVISMVDFNNPDYGQFPKFKQAEAAMLTTELLPGDAIYIPYLWWHHVQALDAVNALVNYWWSLAPEGIGDPRGALLHALMSVRNLPARYRAAWQHQFEYYVFEQHGSINAHLPENRRGVLGKLNIESFKKLRQSLAKSLTR